MLEKNCDVNVSENDLYELNFFRIRQITDPPEKVRQNAEDLVSILRTKLRSSEPYFTMKLMLVGKGSQGKTTLVRRLQDNFAYKDNDLTQGICCPFNWDFN